MKEKQKYTKTVATTLVIASMVGTGVFTSLGFQVGSLNSGFTIIVLWLVGGVVAVLGGLSYAEVSTTIGRSGGEYNYLSKLYHPSLGFMAGMASLVIGFAAPIAAVSMAIGGYFFPVIEHWFNVDPAQEALIAKLISISAITLISAIHMIGVKTGGIIQNILTVIKISFILFFCLSPLFLSNFEPSSVSFAPSAADFNFKNGGLILTAPFFISLVYVYYSYSGWNASVYIAGNLKNPRKDLPFSLLVGAGVVTVLYIALNTVFMHVAEFSELEGQLDIGNVVALKLFGENLTVVFAGLFTLALIASLSASIIAGPRVAETMGEDFRALKFLEKKNKNQSPYLAIILQAGIAIFLVITSTFADLMYYIGVSLSIFAMLTVAGTFIIRKKKMKSELGAEPYKTPLYPITPIIFILINLLMSTYVIYNSIASKDYKVVIYTFGSLFLFFLLYLLFNLFQGRKK